MAVSPHDLEPVRCLECGAVYAKPTEGGTVDRNPGCPRCGYVGWILDVRASGRRRFGEGRLLRLRTQPR
jgi:hypothetical protein